MGSKGRVHLLYKHPRGMTGYLGGVIYAKGSAEKSSSGIYHVMLRGINRHTIFEDDEDFEKFLQVLGDCKAVSRFQLFSYYLMGNHIHLLIKETDEGINS